VIIGSNAHRWWLATVAVLPLALAACGSSHEESASTGSQGGTTTTTAAQPPLDTSPGTPSNALDGRSFRGTSTQAGTSDTVEHDTLIFAAGAFESEACRQYGFTPAAYSTHAEGTAIAVHAVTTSPAEGMMVWDARVTGDAITGGAVWRKAGQADIAYSFSGTAVAGAVQGVGTPLPDHDVAAPS